MLNNSNMNPMGNDYAASLATGSASVAGNNNGHGLDSGSNANNTTSSAAWISSHANMSHANNLSVANKIAVSSASGHWAHSTSPAASCMNSMLDSNSFQPSSGHIAPSITSQASTDPFGFVTAAAHANDLTKSSFYYASQFGSGIRGLTL